MQTEDLEPTDAFMARILEGRALAEAGDFEGAEAHFRGLLTEARDSHAGNHARSISSLLILYGRSGRFFEVHVLSRHLADLARAAGPAAEPTLAFALSSICGALSQLRLVEPLAPALREFRALLDRAEGLTVDLELKYRSAAAARALTVLDSNEARTHIREYQRTLSEHPDLEALWRWAIGMSEAQLALLEHQPDLAMRIMQRLRGGDLTPPHHRLKELTLSIMVHVALGQPYEAQRLAVQAIELLESVQDQPFLASDRIHQGTRLTRELENLGELDLAQRVYDLVAAAVMIRLQQLDECMHQLPELGLGDPQSTEELTGFRKQFMQEQRELMRSVANLLESRGEDHLRKTLTRPEMDGYLVVCAWCESVRPRGGRWLPIGHFVPRDAQLRLTHTMCPTCAERWGGLSA